jgi:hypothetical protein
MRLVICEGDDIAGAISEHRGYGYTRGFCAGFAMGMGTGMGTGMGMWICTRTRTWTRGAYSSLIG